MSRLPNQLYRMQISISVMLVYAISVNKVLLINGSAFGGSTALYPRHFQGLI